MSVCVCVCNIEFSDIWLVNINDLHPIYMIKVLLYLYYCEFTFQQHTSYVSLSNINSSSITSIPNHLALTPSF